MVLTVKSILAKSEYHCIIKENATLKFFVVFPF